MDDFIRPKFLYMALGGMKITPVVVNDDTDDARIF